MTKEKKDIMDRKDSLDSKYKKVNCVNKIKKILFYLSLICSFFITFILDNDFKYLIIAFYILVRKYIKF